MSDPSREVVEAFLRRRERGEDTWNPDGLSREVVAAMRALTIHADALEASRTEVVPIATSPRSATAIRRTWNVLEELLGSARREIIVLGYELSDAGVIAALARQAALGVTIDLMLDPVQTPLQAVTGSWPAGAPVARIWTTAADGSGKPFRMHAKAVLIDGTEAIVGSANLTRSGLRRNLELGVILRGPAVAEIRRFIQQLVDGRIVIRADGVGDERGGRS